MEVFAQIAETANDIFSNSAANLAQAQMGLVVALFILSLVAMFIGWRFGSTRLLITGAMLIATATGVVVFGQNIQDIGTRVISFAVFLGLRAAGSGAAPDAFASDFGAFYQAGNVHFDNMMAMADEACGVIGWMCGVWQPTYLIFAAVGWVAWMVSTIGTLMFWASVFAFKLGVIGTLVLSAFFVWGASRHLALSPLFFCIKSAIYSFCITFMLTAGNLILTNITLVDEPAWYHALPLLVASLAYAVGLFFSSKLALAIGSGVMATAGSMAGPAMAMLALARSKGAGDAGRYIQSVLSAVPAAPQAPAAVRANRVIAAMHGGGGGSGGGGGGRAMPPSPHPGGSAHHHYAGPNVARGGGNPTAAGASAGASAGHAAGGAAGSAAGHAAGSASNYRSGSSGSRGTRDEW